MGMNPDEGRAPESRGGSVNDGCETEAWNAGGNTPTDETRGAHSGGIGGGASSDVKIPSPTDRLGDGA